MIRINSIFKNNTCSLAMFAIFIMATGASCSRSGSDTATLYTVNSNSDAYGRWEALGRAAAGIAIDLIAKESRRPLAGNMIVMTNAGYAEINGSPTQGALDGLVSATGASRGKNSLVEIRSDSWSPLWFSVFDKASGYCAYLERDAGKVAKSFGIPMEKSPDVFSTAVVDRIDAKYLMEYPSDSQAKFNSKVFGGNEFRIVSIANAIAAGAPANVVRTMEFHNHYCPGVTSGILIASYVKTHFPAGKTGYFVQALDPGCKEDALMVLLGATPGNKSYGVFYPGDINKADLVPEARNASTVVFRLNDDSGKWEGLVLAFEWAATSCPQSGNSIVDKLCLDLWYLERLNRPEDFIKVVKEFELPNGVSPQSWTKPQENPLKMIGLAK